jgi:hypothetical protein
MTNISSPGIGTSIGAPPQPATQAASELATTGKEQASQVVGASKQQVQEVAQDAKAHAQQVVAQSRDQLREQANEQAQRLAGTLDEIGGQLHAMARGEGAPEGVVGDVTRQLASTATQASRRLQNGGFEGLVGDVKRFARKQPGVFFLASAGAGFALTRMLRAADTHALVEAAKPGESGNASSPPAFRSESGEIDLRPTGF